MSGKIFRDDWNSMLLDLFYRTACDVGVLEYNNSSSKYTTQSVYMLTYHVDSIDEQALFNQPKTFGPNFAKG